MGEVSEIRRVAIDDLKPYENNAKIHGKKQLEKLVKSIQEFGFMSPVLVDKELHIIAGHISKYARSNYKETIAEASSDVFCNGSKASKQSIAIMNEVKSILGN